MIEGIVVNKEKPLCKSYIPNDLVEYKEYNGIKIDPNMKTLVSLEALKAFNKLRIDARKENIYYVIDSAYRSYDYQKRVFDYNVETKGLEHALKYVAVPGTSEHQTGLAIDVALQRNNEYTDQFNENDYEIKWLHENAYKYGFILRYPKGKENITGYNYEYWHIRYVGKEISYFMHDNNIETLEEYDNENIKQLILK